MKDVIKRKLESAKQEITNLQKKLDAPAPVEKQTVNLVPAGVPEADQAKREMEPKVPGVITGGPLMDKKMKEV
tara:strand:- start:2241 stop:2459 length:219 start_codon:yes stop_codon:yes gene_type:complete